MAAKPRRPSCRRRVSNATSISVREPASALVTLAKQITIKRRRPSVRLEGIYYPITDTPDEPESNPTGEPDELDALLADWPEGVLMGFPPGTPPNLARLYMTMGHIVSALREDGWRPPGEHKAAGQASGARRHRVQTTRRELIERHILPRLSPALRNHLHSTATIETVHQMLRELGSTTVPGASAAVLRSCRTVAPSTVAEDLRQISLQLNAFNPKTPRERTG
jgi:hypothetical protein